MKLFIAATLTTTTFAAFQQMQNTIGSMVSSFCPEDDPDCDDLRKFNTGGSAALTNSITKLDEYGCWCYFDNNHGRGKAQPVDVVDEMCKILHDGYECAMRDAEDEGTTCIPWEVAYDAGLGGSEDEMQKQCTDANPGNNCAIRACLIEGTFVANLLDIFISGGKVDNTKQHENGFNPETECIVKKNGGGPTNKLCCGEYPNRFPFKTQGGDRKCCGSRTYNSNTLKCCDSNASLVKFNC